MAGTISVIIPVYNMEETVGKCIDSVRNQTWRELEIIVVDDGSTDGTALLCDRAAEADARVRVIHRENGGVSAARNTGLAAATGDYIAWLDSDDWMAPEAMRRLMEAVEESGATMALCNYENVGRGGRREKRYRVQANEVITGREALMRLLERRITQSLWANLVPRQLYEGVVFPEGQVFEDVRTTYRFYEQSETVAVINDTLLFNRLIRPDSISHVQSVERRLSSCEAYLARQSELQTRWPESEEIFVRRNHGMLLLSLRSAVFRDTAKHFRENRGRLKPVASYFRKRSAMALGEKPGVGRRVEYWLLTSGTKTGFYLSRLVTLPAKGGTWLER